MRQGKAAGLALLLIATPALLIATPAAARTLEVGPGLSYDRPSAAAAVAEAGDTVLIAPGEYFDCAVWRADRLTIAAASGTVTITDAACEGKAAFVIEGSGITVRGLGFARIRVPEDNGAGIRADGRDLTVRDSRFVNTQMGILGASPGGGFLKVIGCAFSEVGGSLTGRINTAVRATGYDLVRIERSSFTQARGGGDVSVEGARLELVGDTLADEGGHMAGPMVLAQGGALLLEGNTVDLAAGAAARPGVVLAVGEPTAIAVRGNTLRDAGAGATPLLRNWTGQDVAERDNIVPPGGVAVTDAGIAWHRLRAAAAEVRDTLHDLYRRARHIAAVVVHRFG